MIGVKGCDGVWTLIVVAISVLIVVAISVFVAGDATVLARCLDWSGYVWPGVCLSSFHGLCETCPRVDAAAGTLYPTPLQLARSSAAAGGAAAAAAVAHLEGPAMSSSQVQQQHLGLSLIMITSQLAWSHRTAMGAPRRLGLWCV